MNPTIDPTPFLTAAYGLGFLGIVGFLAWVRLERRNLTRLLAALKQETR